MWCIKYQIPIIKREMRKNKATWKVGWIIPDDEVAGLKHHVFTQFAGLNSLSWPQFGPTKTTVAEKDPM